MWRPDDLGFELLADMTDDPVVTLVVTPAGRLVIMGEVVRAGRVMAARNVHLHGEGIGPRQAGHANLQVIARAVMERFDFDELVVEGAVRTTGARQGYRPCALRFARRVRADRP